MGRGRARGGGWGGAAWGVEEGVRAVALLASPPAPTELPFGWQMPSAQHSSDHTKSPSLASAARVKSDKDIIMSLV